MADKESKGAQKSPRHAKRTFKASPRDTQRKGSNESFKRTKRDDTRGGSQRAREREREREIERRVLQET